MDSSSRRPVVIWLALIFLSLVFVSSIWALLGELLFLASSPSGGGLFDLVLSVVLTAVIGLAVKGIFKGSSAARRAGIFCFVLVGFFSLLTLPPLFASPAGTTGRSMGLAILAVKLVGCIALTVAFAFSGTVRDYFRPSKATAPEPPPPPPRFDEEGE